MAAKHVLVPLLSLAIAATAWISPAAAHGTPMEPPAEVALAEAPAMPAMLGVTPVMVGVTPVLAATGSEAQRLQPLSFPVAAGLTYGMPIVVGGVGFGLMGLMDLLGAPYGVLSTLGMITALGSVAAFTSGYIYAGDPGRGAWMLLGEYGVLVLSMLVAAGVAVVLTGGGQSAGFALPLVAIPVVGGGWLWWQYVKMMDLKGLIERKNRAAGFTP